MRDEQQRDPAGLKGLTEVACRFGASNAKVILTSEILIEEDLATMIEAQVTYYSS